MMHSFGRRHARAPLGAIVTALALVACSGGSSGQAQPAAVAATSSSSSPTPSPSVTLSPTPSPKPSAKAKPTPSPTPKPAPTHSASAKPTPTHTPAPPTATGVYVFPVQGCSVSYAHVHHDYPATDIFAPRNCAYVAPTSGRIDEVSYTDRWPGSHNAGAYRGGLTISMIGNDGVRYYGSHFQSIAPGIRPGLVVRAGQLLARVGNSGDAAGITTHVHFGISWPTGPGIWWVRRGEVYPWPYLDAWRAHIAKSPAAAVAARHAAVGNVGCTVDC